MLKKIVIIGPESTGKSTLCQQLADHYHTLWCPEFAREYLLEHGMNYTYDDLLTIAKGQLNLEEKYTSALINRTKETQSPHSPLASPYSPLFIDTDMYVMKVWCEFVFNNCHRFILDQIVERKYDLYLLCDVDLPWVADELREYPDLNSRERLYLIYKDMMINQTVPWIDIYGTHEERLQRAIKGIDSIFP